jgi:hypothetical protein
MRVAIVCDVGAPTEGDPALYRPLKADNVVDVLNGAAASSTVASSGVGAVGSLVLGDSNDNMFEYEQPGDGFPGEDTVQRRGDPGIAPGLDELISGNPLVDPYFDLKSARLNDSTTIEPIGGQTRRSELRADLERESQGVPLDQSAPARAPVKAADGIDRSVHRLREYLEGNLLGGPVQIAWPDAGVLTLDPKHGVYHSAEPLRALEIYCRESPRLDDWRRLTTAELTGIRESQPSQPYQKLIWLDVLLHSGGKLASNLDPGGTYELTRWLEIARDYPQYARISAAMMKPARLHEIAAACGCPMSEVFGVVNAYDAIDCLKKTPRVSRHAEAEDAKPRSSFLDRLRKPFGKS